MGMSLGSFASRSVATRVVATDGTGDFTKIQDAVDDLPSSGGVVYVKEGTYSEDVSVTGDDVSIIGSGKSSRNNGTGTTTTPFTISGDNCYIDKMNITHASSGSGTLLSFSGADGTITNCWFSNAEKGVVCTGSNCIIFGNHINDLGGLGAQRSIEVTTGTGSVIYGNNCSDGDIMAINQDKSVVSNNYVSGSNNRIDIESDYCTVNANVVDTGKTIGLNILGNFNAVSGNVVRAIVGTGSGVKTAGAKLNGSSNSFNGNVIEDVSVTIGANGWGIWVRGDNNIINGNRIDNTADDGIFVDTTADKTLIDSNIILNFTNEAIDDDGTNTKTGDNIIT